MKILIYNGLTENKAIQFETYKDMFVFLSENGYIIEVLMDGTIKTNKGNIDFTRIEVNNTKEDFLIDAKSYRDELRNSYALLKKQGLPMGQEIVNSLQKQLAFIETDEPKSEKKVKSTKKNESEEDIKEKEKNVIEESLEEKLDPNEVL